MKLYSRPRKVDSLVAEGKLFWQELRFTALLTTKDQYELFKSGALASSKAIAPHPGLSQESVVLYIPTLIMGDRYWTPALFKSLLRDMDVAMARKKLKASDAFATALDKRSVFLMKRSRFIEVGVYKDGYKILLATKESSAMFRNFVR